MSQHLIRQIVAAASWGMQTALDVGCGEGPYRPLVAHCETIDVGPKPSWSAFHYEGDVLDQLKRIDDHRFDLVMALDVIEHLEEDRGHELIEACKRVARRRVLFFTPNGFLPVEHENPYMHHLSGWTADLFRQHGLACATLDFGYCGEVKPDAALLAVWEGDA